MLLGYLVDCNSKDTSATSSVYKIRSNFDVYGVLAVIRVRAASRSKVKDLRGQIGLNVTNRISEEFHNLFKISILIFERGSSRLRAS